jgi:arginase
MINIPHRGSAYNYGVEFGADSILTPDILNTFESQNIDCYRFPLPEEISVNEYDYYIAKSSKEFRDLILNTLQDDEIQVMLGGDHSSAFGSVLAVLERYKNKEVGYIQFDTHADINKFSTSPTGNFHGMFLRPILGDFDSIAINSLVKNKIHSENMMYVGNLDLDEAENTFINANNIVTFNEYHLRNQSYLTRRQLKEFISKFDHLHISFDIDIFDKTIVSATGTPNEHGLFEYDVFPLLDILKDVSSFSLDLVEVNPLKEGAKETILLAQRVLNRLLSLDTNQEVLEPSVEALFENR